MTKMTQAERLARLEAQQEERFKAMFEALERNNPHPLVGRIESKVDALGEEMRGELKAIRFDLEDDKANLAELENKGKGAAAVLSVMFTMLGAVIMAFWDSVLKIFN